MNPGQNIRTHAKLGIVKGRFRKRPAVCQIHQTQHHAGGPQIHGHAQDRSRVFGRQNAGNPPSAPILIENAPDLVIGISQDIRQHSHQIQIHGNVIRAQPGFQRLNQPVRVRGIVFQRRKG